MKKLMLILSTLAVGLAVSCGSEDGKQPVEKKKDRRTSLNLTSQDDSRAQVRSVQGALNKDGRN